MISVRNHSRLNIIFSRQITLGRVLKAVLIFKGIMIEWVTVKGYDETFDEDLWAESRHQVFRRVQEHTHAAMLHFYSPTLPDLAVKFFLVIGFQHRTGNRIMKFFLCVLLSFVIQAWLHSYLKLFSEPCKKCGNFLLNSYPPTWRDFRQLEPYHEECK